MAKGPDVYVKYASYCDSYGGTDRNISYVAREVPISTFTTTSHYTVTSNNYTYSIKVPDVSDDQEWFTYSPPIDSMTMILKLSQRLPGMSLFHDQVEGMWNIVCIGDDGNFIYYNENENLDCLIQEAYGDRVVKNA